MIRNNPVGGREYLSSHDGEDRVFFIAGHQGSAFINIHFNGRTILKTHDTSAWTDERIAGYCDGWVSGMYDGKGIGRSDEKARIRNLLGL